MPPLSLLGDAWSVARRDGLSNAIKAGLRRVNASYEGYFYYTNYRYKRLRGYPCVDEDTFFRTLEVNPHDITALPTRRFDKWKNAGEIRGGEWDQPVGQFNELPIVQALRGRFEEGREWEGLQYVQRAYDTVRSGESTWNGCRSIEDIWDRCHTLDRLYESIKEDGYRSQAELHDSNPKSILMSGSFDRSQTDIAIHIDRGGRYLFVDGRHRLAIAQILDLERIPVRVVVRHAQWQGIRKKVSETGRVEDLPGDLRAHSSHPDIEPLRST